MGGGGGDHDSGGWFLSYSCLFAKNWVAKNISHTNKAHTHTQLPLKQITIAGTENVPSASFLPYGTRTEPGSMIVAREG